MNAHPIELRRRIFNYNLSPSVRNTAKPGSPVGYETVKEPSQLFLIPALGFFEKPTATGKCRTILQNRPSKAVF